MAMEWTLTIEGRNEFGKVCRRQIQMDKSWERLCDGAARHKKLRLRIHASHAYDEDRTNILAWWIECRE